MFSNHQSTLPRTPSMPRVSGELPSMVRASTLTMSLSYSASSASCHACLRTNSTTFCATCSVFIFLLCLDRQLLAEEFRQFIERALPASRVDRKSTRLNSSHVAISYAVFCLKKKKH